MNTDTLITLGVGKEKELVKRNRVREISSRFLFYYLHIDSGVFSSALGLHQHPKCRTTHALDLQEIFSVGHVVCPTHGSSTRSVSRLQQVRTSYHSKTLTPLLHTINDVIYTFNTIACIGPLLQNGMVW